MSPSNPHQPSPKDIRILLNRRHLLPREVRAFAGKNASQTFAHVLRYIEHESPTRTETVSGIAALVVLARDSEEESLARFAQWLLHQPDAGAHQEHVVSAMRFLLNTECGPQLDRATLVLLQERVRSTKEKPDVFTPPPDPSAQEHVLLGPPEKKRHSDRLERAHEALMVAGRDANTNTLNAAFDAIFDVVQDARATGITDECNQLLQWAALCADLLHLEVLLPCLRLTANFRQHLPAWNSLKRNTAATIRERGENEAALLHGL